MRSHRHEIAATKRAAGRVATPKPVVWRRRGVSRPRRVGFASIALGALLLLPPSLLPAATITGRVDQPDQVTAVAAVDRAARQSYPGAFDRSSARFTVSNLPTNTPLDCVIDYAGARLEGVNFHVPRSDYVEEQPLSVEDVATITDKIGRMNQFENIVDILTITGNVQHAVILLNKLRTTEFIGRQPGEVIWRAELWHFERPEETWAKVQDELFVVLYRERIPNKVYRKKAIVFDPRLGGLRLTAEVPEVDLGEIRLPAPQPGVRLRQGEEIK